MPPKARPKLARFLEKVEIAPNGCWIWKAALGRGGYPVFDAKAAHRYAYEAMVGPIPAGLTLDHVCHNRDAGCVGGNGCLHRRCVNPEHLEPINSRENTLRSATSIGGRNARKTHCVNGHVLSGDNIYVSGRKRACKTCQIDRQRARRAERRLENPYERPLAEFCKRGHPRTPENVDANRRCKLCRRK